jgi:hypothetical protein
MANDIVGGSEARKVASTVAPFKSEISSYTPTPTDGRQSIPAVIKQSERLFTTRSRSVSSQNTGGDRGERAYIKVLTTDTKRSLDRKTSASHGISNPTSLDNGALKDAVTGKGYASFLLTDVSCALEEKLQIMEVFGDSEVSYYFGRQPIMFNFAGLLIDSVDNNWFVEFIEMYAHVMRGSQLARNYELLQIVLPNMSIIGTITRMNWSQNAQRDVDIPFQFSFLAKQITPIKVITSNIPVSDSGTINWGKASSFMSQSQINGVKLASGAQHIQQLAAVIQNPLSSVKDYATSLTNLGSNSVFGSLGSPVGMTAGTSSLSNIGSATSSMSGLFVGINSNLSGVRASLFSPVYGVLSSLTKLIRTSGADVSKVFSAFTDPVRTVLRDIRNISSAAIGVVNLANSTIKGLTNQVRSVDRELQSTLLSLKKTAGVVTNSPKTIASSLRELFEAGKLPATTRFLVTRGRSTTLSSGVIKNPKMALLSSGPRHTPEQGAKL